MGKENTKNSKRTSNNKRDQKEVKTTKRNDYRNRTKAKEEKRNNKSFEKKEKKVIEVDEIEEEELDFEDEFDEDLEDFDDELDDDIDDEDVKKKDDDIDDDDEDEESDELDEESEEELDDESDDFDEDIDDDIDDEDLEDFDEDLDEDIDEEPVIKEVKSNKHYDKRDNKKKDDEKKSYNKKIDYVEKIAKNNKKKAKKGDSKLTGVLLFLDKYRYPIYTFIAGVLISVFVAMLIWPDRIATLKDGTQPIVKVGSKTYNADNLYEKMKDYYSVSLLLDQIDNDLLTKMYPEDDEMTKKIQENAEYYLNMYKQYYNYTQEQFLEKNGFSSYEAFLDYLRLDYRRNKYLDEYVEKNTTDSEIQKYYDDNVFGDINTQHVLVEVKSGDDDKSDKLSDEDAKKLAEEIISKLNDGTSWETIQKDYKDKITFEDLSYQSWDASLEETFMTALKGMEDNSYSKEPVKTSYGYHVIYRKDQKKKPSLKKSKDKIVEKIISDKKAKDSNLLYKSLISLRDDKKIKFSDTVMKSKYDAYCKQYK